MTRIYSVLCLGLVILFDTVHGQKGVNILLLFFSIYKFEIQLDIFPNANANVNRHHPNS